MLTFTPITLEHHALLRKYYAGCDYHLCEYSAGTKLMWSLYLRPSFAEEAGCLIVRNRIVQAKRALEEAVRREFFAAGRMIDPT